MRPDPTTAERILLVDDEASVREFLSIMLEDEGYLVEQAASGEEGVSKLKKTEFDLILTDLKMSGVSGMDLLREAKKYRPSTQVIVMTAFGTTETAVEGMKLGAFDYLLKPADFEDLKKILDRARNRKAEQDERIRRAEVRQLLRKGGNI